MPILYKVLNHDGSCCKGGTGKWNLPSGKRPGKWMPKINNLKACKRGYHLVTIDRLLLWLGPSIWEAEGRGSHIDENYKSVWEEARLLRKTAWDDRAARLFASDCAEHVLHCFEQCNPNDNRPRLAIKTARDFAEGKVDSDAAYDAYAAARAAAAYDDAYASAAAHAAAYAANAAAYSAHDAAYAAYSAAHAAHDAANAAAYAAYAAYSAAHAAHAAYSAAHAAAYAAYAAYSAAHAAHDAANAAAYDAERKWQVELLKSIIGGE